MFPKTHYDDQVDSTVQYLQWVNKINNNIRKIRNFSLNNLQVFNKSYI